MRINWVSMTIAIACLMSTQARAQLFEAFDVVSIKSNTSGEPGGTNRAQPGRYVGINVPVMRLIGIAYRPIQEFEGGLDWIRTERFDIEAKAASFKGLTYFGVDAEYWFLQGPTVNASVGLGGHMTNVNGGGDSSGIDTALLLSARPAALACSFKPSLLRLDGLAKSSS